MTEPGDGVVRVPGAELDLTAHADWTAVPARTWLAWLRDTLGGTYTVHEAEHALLLTPHDDRSARVTLWTARTPLTATALLAAWPLPNDTLLGPRIVSNAVDSPYTGEAAMLFA